MLGADTLTFGSSAELWDLTNSVADTELGKPNEVSGHNVFSTLSFLSGTSNEDCHMTLAHIAILGFFFFVMSVGGLALFFGSDYAQKKWNPEGK